MSVRMVTEATSRFFPSAVGSVGSILQALLLKLGFRDSVSFDHLCDFCNCLGTVDGVFLSL